MRTRPGWIASVLVLSGSLASSAQSVPAPNAPAPPPAAPSSSTPVATPPDGARPVRLRDVEHQINGLHETVDAEHAAVEQLVERVMATSTGGRLVLTHENQMGRGMRLVRFRYLLDGQPIAARADENGGLEESRTIPLFDGTLPAGSHTLQVETEFRAEDYGFVSYVRGYRFHVSGSQTFEVRPRQTLTMQVVHYEDNNTLIMVDPADRPHVRFTVTPQSSH